MLLTDNPDPETMQDVWCRFFQKIKKANHITRKRYDAVRGPHKIGDSVMLLNSHSGPVYVAFLQTLSPFFGTVYNTELFNSGAKAPKQHSTDGFRKRTHASELKAN